jgi:hypothetical protein
MKLTQVSTDPPSKASKNVEEHLDYLYLLFVLNVFLTFIVDFVEVGWFLVLLYFTLDEYQ